MHEHIAMDIERNSSVEESNCKKSVKKIVCNFLFAVAILWLCLTIFGPVDREDRIRLTKTGLQTIYTNRIRTNANLQT